MTETTTPKKPRVSTLERIRRTKRHLIDKGHAVSVFYEIDTPDKVTVKIQGRDPIDFIVPRHAAEHLEEAARWL